MWVSLILLLALGNGDLYREACRLLLDGRLAEGAEVLGSLSPGDAYLRKAESLIPVLETLEGKGGYRGAYAPGRAPVGRLELGVGKDGTFTAGLLGGEGPLEAYVPFVFGCPVPASSRWTVWMDGESRPLPPNGSVSGAGAVWTLEGIEFRLSLTPATTGHAPPEAALLAFQARNLSARSRELGFRLSLDLVDGFDDAPVLWAAPFGPLVRSRDWCGDDVPPFLLCGRHAVVLRSPDLEAPDRAILCSWPAAEDSLWDFPLLPDEAPGPDTALVLTWDPGMIHPGEIHRAALRLGRCDPGLDRTGSLTTLALVKPCRGQEMKLTLYVENSAPGILHTLKEVEAALTLPDGLGLKPGVERTRRLGDLSRDQGGQVHWTLARTGEAGGRRTISIELSGRDMDAKRISLPVDLPAHQDLAGRALGPRSVPLPGTEVKAWASGGERGRAVADPAGAYRIRGLPAGAYDMQGRKILYRKPARKRGHEDLDHAVYELVLDSDRVEDSGEIRMARAAVGEGRDLSLEHATFRYNLLISIEWDADRAYMENVVRGMRAASNYLYDALDGQMCFGKIAIYDNAVHWNDADLQVFTQNSVHANANVDGYGWRWEPHAPWNTAIHFGRSWNGGSWGYMFHATPWDDQLMYRTIVHEFGHYGLGLFDEYIGQINGQWRGLAIHEMCPSFMGYQYVIGGDFNSDRDTELCYRGNHHTYTAQGIYRGMSCWEWVKRTHDGVYEGVPVTLLSPAERGRICPGPIRDIGRELQASIHDADTGAFDTTLGIQGPWGEEVWGIPVWTVVSTTGRKMFQGSTGVNRMIRLLGVHVGDRVEAVHQGRMAAMTLSERQPGYELQFLPYPSGPSDYPVLVSVLPERAGAEELSALTLEVEAPLGMQEAPLASLRCGSTERPIILHSGKDNGLWGGSLALGQGMAGQGSIEIRLVTPSGERLILVTDFCTSLLSPEGTEAHNFDGTVSLKVPSGAVETSSIMVFSSSLVPSIEMDRCRLAGRIESIQGAGGPPRFETAALLSLVMPSEASDGAEPDLSLRRWKGGSWVEIPSELEAGGEAVLAWIHEGGLFGLFENL